MSLSAMNLEEESSISLTREVRSAVRAFTWSSAWLGEIRRGTHAAVTKRCRGGQL